MSLKRYTSPKSQIILIALICFCTVGMFNVILSLGSNGLDTTLGNISTICVYTFFIISGLFGGSIVNILGPRLSFGISTIGYVIYALMFFTYYQTKAWWTLILSGTVLGLCAGILWSAQGQIMMSYPTEDQKGIYVSIFWMIFNLGSVLGGFIPFGLNFDNKDLHVTPTTYLGLAAIMVIGTLLCCFLAPISEVVRDDGRPVLIKPYRSVAKEAAAALAMIKDWKMLCLMPLFLCSNWFYAYQFQIFNGEVFTIRTRSLNTVFYWFAQMVGALFLGKFLDNTSMKRSKRGFYGMIIVFGLSTIIWIGALFFQLTYTLEYNPYKLNPIDLTYSNWGPLLILYISFGLMDSMVQTLAYWIMGALDNDPLVLSRYAGFYKALQSLGSAGSWAISITNTPYLAQLLICWCLLEISIPGLYLVIRSIKDTNMLLYSYDDEVNQKGYKSNQFHELNQTEHSI